MTVMRTNIISYNTYSNRKWIEIFPLINFSGENYLLWLLARINESWLVDSAHTRHA